MVFRCIEHEKLTDLKPERIMERGCCVYLKDALAAAAKASDQLPAPGDSTRTMISFWEVAAAF